LFLFHEVHLAFEMRMDVVHLLLMSLLHSSSLHFGGQGLPFAGHILFKVKLVPLRFSLGRLDALGLVETQLSFYRPRITI